MTVVDEFHLLTDFEPVTGYFLWEDPLAGEDMIPGAAAQNCQTPINWVFAELPDLVLRINQWIILCVQAGKHLALYENE